MKLTGRFKLNHYQQMIAGLKRGMELLCNFAFPSGQIRKLGVLHLMGRVRQQFEVIPLGKHYSKSWEEAAFCRSQREPGVCPCFTYICVLGHVRLCDPIDCSPPGSSVHGIFQARMLEWVAISFAKGSSQPRDRTHISCIAGDCLPMSHQEVLQIVTS